MQNLLIIIVFSYTSLAIAGGNTWNETNDAPSFPDGQVQVTQGEGDLLYLFGETSAADLRDAYCIKMTDHNNFRITTDANIDSNANASFDTRLFLFDQNQKPLLFNDDTPPSSSPFASTLTATATDGSGYILSQPGEYTLVVAGFSDGPLDSQLINIFNQSADIIHSASPTTGRFASWEGSSPATGSYILAMQGVEFCQEKLDIIGTNSSVTDSSMCFGDEQGEFTVCHNNSSTSNKEDIATGYFKKDKHLDVMFDQFGESPTLCLGAGVDGFKSCQSLDIGVTNTTDIAMADINNDGNLDAAFIFAVGQVSDVVKICIGDGNNGFLNSCTNLTVEGRFYSNIDFAYMDTDWNIDLIVHGFNSITICSGDGLGGFGTCNEVSVQSGRGLEVFDVNNDNHLDIVTYAGQQQSQVCINNGSGFLTCTVMNALLHDTTGMAMGDLNSDGNIDVVFSNNNGFKLGTNKVCLGDGLGVFTCTDVSGIADTHQSVSLGDLNSDGIVDAVFGAINFARICYGVGDGTFTGCFNDSKIKVNQIQLGEFGDFSKWIETGDAPSYPDNQAQVTRGNGSLPFIIGATDSGLATPDFRDAYCIKIDDPTNFIATTDVLTNPNASASFDTRLFLFDKLGTPILFNDDTAPSVSPFTSTLTNTATDGSNFILNKADEYALVVSGFSEDPLDSTASNIYNQNFDLIHAPKPTAGRFVNWQGIGVSIPKTGSYVLALQGVSPCQDKLDVVGSNSTTSSSSTICAGDGNGGFSRCNTSSNDSTKNDVTIGYLDQDAHLDVIFDVFSSSLPTVCLGNGDGGYADCYNLGIGTNNSNATAMGDLNGDGLTDTIFITSNANHEICFGNGIGGFLTCNEVLNNSPSKHVKLAYIDDDAILDVVISKNNEIEVCFLNATGNDFDGCLATTVEVDKFEIADFNNDGNLDIVAIRDTGNSSSICLNDGSGVLGCSPIAAGNTNVYNLAVADLNFDNNVDIVFANSGASTGKNRVCLGDGDADFSCSDVSGIVGNHSAVKLGLLNDDGILDAIFAGFGQFSRVCIGNGNGTFSSCVNDNTIKIFEFELGEFGGFDVIFANGLETLE